jgi:hypothetical protein
MANALFSSGREGILDDTIPMNAGDIRAMLVKSTYSFDDNDKFLSDLGAVDNGRTTALQSKTFALGVFDAADISMTCTAAVACNAYIIFYHTGADGTARLIAYIDTPTSGLPLTPAAGGTLNIQWDSGANKIFKL